MSRREWPDDFDPADFYEPPRPASEDEQDRECDTGGYDGPCGWEQGGPCEWDDEREALFTGRDAATGATR